MQQVSLLSWMKQEGLLNEFWYDCLRYELDKHVYYYGDHFKRPLNTVRQSKTEKAKYDIKLFLSSLGKYKSSKEPNNSKPVIISNAYFNFNNKVAQSGYTVIQPPWTNDRNHWKYYDFSLIKLCLDIKKQFEFSDFSYLLSGKFLQLLEDFFAAFKNYITEKNIKALVVPNDESFFENISIKIFRAINLPSFIFLHGLPARYNSIDEHRSDYLIVWGKKLKEIYVSKGMAENKIFISGHPSYQQLNNQPLQFSLDNVLVLTKSLPGSPHSDGVNLADRGNLIVYLLSVQKVLKLFNVKKVRFRPHPSENTDWYMQFLDYDFFVPDNQPLNNSLKNTSLVIGPISSVFLESLYNNVNYLIYEPKQNDTTIFNTVIEPPFDGFDDRIPVAYDEDTLSKFLKAGKCVDTSLLSDFYQIPFDLGFIKSLIK